MRKIFYISILIFIVAFPAQLFPQDTFLEEKIVLPTDTTCRYPLQNIAYHSPSRLKLALVLSGGGARGMAHLGVLKALEEHEIPVDLIVGSSIGSVVGGFYAAGYSADELIQIFREIDWNNLFTDQTQRTNLFWSQKSTPRKHFLELRFDKGIPYIPSALSAGQKIFDIIYSRLLYANFQSANNFDNLRIPFRAVATDLISGERVVLSRGDLAEAISGSMAVPLLFAPVEWDGMWLADGGIRDNLPVDVAIANNADLVIAVDVTSPLRTTDQMKAPWQLADQVTSIMMKEPTIESRKMADFVVLPELQEHGAADFSGLDSLVQRGYEATLGKIDSIRNMIRIYEENLWGENSYFGTVATVSLHGNYSTSDELIFDKLRIKPERGLYRYDILKDLEYLYTSGRVANCYAVIRGTSSRLDVEYYVEEYPVIDSISVRTNALPLAELNIQSIRHLAHQQLNITVLLDTLDMVIEELLKKGYSLSRIVNVSLDEDARHLIIDIDEGYISDIQIKGNRITREGIILREVYLRENELFSSSRAIESIQNIYSTGLFERVTFNVERKANTNRLIIRVKEKKYLMMRLGLNASLERKAKAFIEVAEDNLLGREIKLSLLGMIGDLDREAEFKFYSVRLLNTLLTYRFSLYYRDRWDKNYRNYNFENEYLSIRRGLTFVLGQQISRLGSISAEFRWDNVSVHSEFPGFTFADHYKIRSIVLRSSVDKRDKLPFPDRGIYNRWFWETGKKGLLGGSTSFIRFYIALEGYYPLVKSFVYHVRASGGSGDLTVPFSEFFTLGGQNDFPGLHERELFGRRILTLNNELRYKFRWQVPVDMYAGITFNIGGVWESPEDPLRRSDFITSWSTFLALNSAFGPIQFSFSRLENIRNIVYFSIGYEF